MIQTKEATTFEKYPEYKDSSVEWLGEIPEEWELKRFKYIAGTQKGKLPKHIVSENLNNEPPYMSMEYLRGGEENQWVLDKDVIVVDENETLLLWDGSNAGEFIKSRKGVISSTVAHISFKNINNRYAWYFSKKLEIELRKRTIGMGIPHVNGGFLNNSLVTIPFPQEQTAIVNFLDDKTSKIDTAIAQKEQMIALLKERKQIVIQNAVTGKWSIVNGQWAETPKEKMKDSGVEWIGEIPEGWEVKRCKYLFYEATERSLDGSEELLSVSHMTGVTPRSEKEVYMFMAEDYSGSKLCKRGDVIYNIMWAWMGALGVAHQLGIVSPSYGVYRQLDSFVLNTHYLEYKLKTTEYIDYYNKVSTGLHTSRLRFYAHMFMNMEIAFPKRAEQNKVVHYIESQSTKMDKAIALQQTQIEKLKEYKATLIDGAVTGKIRVSG